MPEGRTQHEEAGLSAEAQLPVNSSGVPAPVPEQPNQPVHLTEAEAEHLLKQAGIGCLSSRRRDSSGGGKRVRTGSSDLSPPSAAKQRRTSFSAAPVEAAGSATAASGTVDCPIDLTVDSAAVLAPGSSDGSQQRIDAARMSPARSTQGGGVHGEETEPAVGAALAPADLSDEQRMALSFAERGCNLFITGMPTR